MAVLAAAASGCAYMHATTVRTTDPRTNVVKETTSVRCYTVLDSSSQLTKLTTSTGGTSGKGYFIPNGTSIGTLNQEASGSNAVAFTEAVVGAVVSSAIKAAK